MRLIWQTPGGELILLVMLAREFSDEDGFEAAKFLSVGSRS